MHANGAMAHPAVESRFPGLGLRAVSALVLMPPVLGAVYFGSPYFEILLCGCAVIMAWEWERLCGGRTRQIEFFVLAATFVVAVVLTSLGRPLVALSVLLAGSAGLLISAAPWRESTAPSDAKDGLKWRVAGAFYIGACCMALTWLRTHPAFGFEIVAWLLATVWAVDIGAYISGRLIGGPRLVPAISPNKTIAGLLGGMACAGAVGAAVAAVFYHRQSIVPLAASSVVLGFVAQAGDVAESWIKRRRGFKDSGHLIPGHGGLLDRVDGLLAATAVTALFFAVREGGFSTWS
jgi:phosphatidate cytidylyltransferase